MCCEERARAGTKSRVFVAVCVFLACHSTLSAPYSLLTNSPFTATAATTTFTTTTTATFTTSTTITTAAYATTTAALDQLLIQLHSSPVLIRAILGADAPQLELALADEVKGAGLGA